MFTIVNKKESMKHRGAMVMHEKTKKTGMVIGEKRVKLKLHKPKVHVEGYKALAELNEYIQKEYPVLGLKIVASYKTSGSIECVLKMERCDLISSNSMQTTLVFKSLVETYFRGFTVSFSGYTSSNVFSPDFTVIEK